MSELKTIYLYMIVTTLSKVAARKFLTEEGLACETEDDLWYNVGPPREQITEWTARIEMHQSELLKNNQSQQSIMLYKITHDQSTSSPEED